MTDMTGKKAYDFVFGKYQDHKLKHPEGTFLMKLSWKLPKDLAKCKRNEFKQLSQEILINGPEILLDKGLFGMKVIFDNQDDGYNVEFIDVEKPFCAVRDTEHGCEVWTRNDVGYDIFAHIERQGLFLQGPVTAPDEISEIISVKMEDDTQILAKQLTLLLKNNSDFAIIDFDQFNRVGNG